MGNIEGGLLDSIGEKMGTTKERAPVFGAEGAIMIITDSKPLASRLVVLRLSENVPQLKRRVLIKGKSYNTFGVCGLSNAVAIEASGDFTGFSAEFVA